MGSSRFAGACAVGLFFLGCASPDPVGEASQRVSATDAIARAEQWVQAKLLYCQSPNHASDAVDPACPAVCTRTDNAAWNPYRSDCSGLVSWAWGLPAPGRTTYGFAPFQTDLTQVIPAAQLAAGDAVNNSDHVMLFKAWAGAGQATFIEEPGCSASPNYAHEFTSAVTLNGNSITVAYNHMTFTAIRNKQLGPSCQNQCTPYPRAGIARAPTGSGYWIADAAGHVLPNGNAGWFGDLSAVALAEPVVGIASTPSGKGYWLVAADGGVFSFGDAGFHGSAGGTALQEPVVGMAATPDGGGYWLVAGDGGVFAYGDAAFFGSTGGMKLNNPVIGMAPSPTGQGYWLVATDGGIFAYGDAGFHGSAGGMALNAPLVGMAATPSGGGYWLGASDGGIFAYGDAAFHGSAGGMALNQPIVSMAAIADGSGYWLAAADGGVFTYGSAPYLGNGLGTTCSGASPRECLLGADGCYEWHDDAACPSGQACAHGTCQASCTDACTAGASQCSGAGVQICGAFGSTPCNDWSAPAPCPSGQSCQGGVCASPTCADDCEPGASQCQGGALATCTGTKAGGCHTWGAPTPCMDGQVCGAGGCIASADGTGGGASSTSSAGSGAAGAGGSVSSAGGGSDEGGASSGRGGPTGSGGSSEDAGSSGGCSTSPGGGSFAWAGLAALAFLGIQRRRAR